MSRPVYRYRVQTTLIRDKRYSSMAAATRDLGLSEGSVKKVINGKQPKAGGYVFKLAKK